MYVCVCVCTNMYVWLKMTCTGRGLDLLLLHLRNLESSRTHLCLHLHLHGGPGPKTDNNESLSIEINKAGIQGVIDRLVDSSNILWVLESGLQQRWSQHRYQNFCQFLNGMAFTLFGFSSCCIITNRLELSVYIKRAACLSLSPVQTFKIPSILLLY